MCFLPFLQLLGRFYSQLYASHPGLSGNAKKRYTIPPPSMLRDGNKRSIFANVADICKKMRRSPEHVIQFLFAELGTTGSVDASSRLVIKGRFQQKQIESVLRRYIGRLLLLPKLPESLTWADPRHFLTTVEYVTCKTCKSPDTLLEKDNRLYFVTCNSCQSRRSVASITSGYKALTSKRSVPTSRGWSSTSTLTGALLSQKSDGRETGLRAVVKTLVCLSCSCAILNMFANFCPSLV